MPLSSDPQIRVGYEDETLRVGCLDNLTIAVWWDAPTAAQMRALDDVDMAMRARTTGLAGFMNIIVTGFPRFSAEVREEAARQSAFDDGRSGAAAHVVLTRGLVGAAARAFLSGVFLAARPGYPNRVFGDPMEAARWLAPLLEAHGAYRWSPERVSDLVAALLHPAPGAI